MSTATETFSSSLLENNGPTEFIDRSSTLAAPIEFIDRTLADASDITATAPQPTVVVNNVSTSWTFADLVIVGVELYAVSVAVMFGMVLVRHNGDIKKTMGSWFTWIFWPISLLFRHITYAYVKSQAGALMTNLPKECSQWKRLMLNTMSPGLGKEYCAMIQELNHMKSITPEGSLRGLASPQLLWAASVASGC